MNDTKGLAEEIRGQIAADNRFDHADNRTRLLERALTALKAQGWQPIESAPKDPDGDFILMHSRDGITLSARWNGHQFSFGHHSWPQVDFTHWMPIPQPPKEPNNKEEA